MGGKSQVYRVVRDFEVPLEQVTVEAFETELGTVLNDTETRALWYNKKGNNMANRYPNVGRVPYSDTPTATPTANLSDMAMHSVPVHVSPGNGTTEFKGRITHYYSEPVAVIDIGVGEPVTVPARTVRPLSEDEMKGFLLSERERRATMRERDADIAMQSLRELLTAIKSDQAFGRIAMPEYAQQALDRLVKSEKPVDPTPDAGACECWLHRIAPDM